MKHFYCIYYFISIATLVHAQCLENQAGIIWTSTESTISFEELAKYAAPMLWFSPDEINLFDKHGNKQLPNAFPFDKEGEKPVVYYKLRNVYSQDKSVALVKEDRENTNQPLLNLQQVRAIDLDYYYYFLEETGSGSHPHDIESVTLQIRVFRTTTCPDYLYAIAVTKVTGRAHGLHWYNNTLKVDKQTFFPLSILIEEGKHASCTDKNADGIYTPTFDVTEKVNDAWGVRDIITSGRLVSAGFQSWMTKKRTESTLLFPPYPEDSRHYENFQEKFDTLISKSVYELRPYPDYKQVKKTGEIAASLDELMRGKKPHDWPDIAKIGPKQFVRQWAKSNHTALSFSYRWDDTRGLSIAIPLLLVKNVEAPVTGGWLYHKFYFQPFSSIADSTLSLNKLLGHQIVHASSASRWLDTYVGLGYEIYDTNPKSDITDNKVYFASEAGIKIRVNISKTPLKFLKVLGTDFWGVRLGWKNVGLNRFVNSGFVIEFGAGVF